MRDQSASAVREKNLNRILVAVPTMGGVIKSKTAQTLFQLSKMLTVQGFNPVMLNIDNSDIVTVRNFYANYVLNHDQFDALLFIDSDMEFEPRLVRRMIDLNVGIASAAYTSRELNFDKLAAALQDDSDISLARAKAARFNVLTSFDSSKPVTIHKRDGFYSLAATGMGVCLIRKSALQAMVHQGVVEKRIEIQDSQPREVWGFFDMYRLNNVLLLEDYSFCYRWTQLMNRPLWTCVDTLVKHIGEFEYGATYQSIIDADLSPLKAAQE